MSSPSHTSRAASETVPTTFKNGSGEGYSNIRDIGLTEDSIIEIINIIGNATKCNEWREHAKKMFETKSIIPPYVQVFYNLVSDYEEMPEDTWLQPYLLNTILPIVTQLRVALQKAIENGKKMLAQWKAKNVQTDLTSVLEAVKMSKFKKGKWLHVAERNLGKEDAFVADDIKKFADCFSHDLSWSVMSLFYHSAIVVVPGSSPDHPDYAYWPTSAPKVNNRHVEIGLLTEPNAGFINQLCNSDGRTWDHQPVRIIPYCVASELVHNEDSVLMDTVLGTNYYGVDSDVETNTALGPEFAGKIVAKQISFEEVKKLYKSLTECDITDIVQYDKFTELSDVDRAMFGLSKCFEALMDKKYYNGLKTVNDWCKLYVQLWMHTHNGEFDLEQRWMHPTTPNDLVHKTYMLFMSNHAIRLSFFEGQKRATSSKYALLGFMPRNVFQFHASKDNVTEYKIGGRLNFYNQSHDCSKVPEKNAGVGFNSLLTFANAGKTVSSMFYIFKTKHHDMNNDVLHICRQFSAHLVAEGNTEQVRSWMNIVIMLTTESELVTMLKANKDNKDVWTTSDNLKKTIRIYRELFVGIIWKQEKGSLVIREDCQDNTALLDSLDGTIEKDFVKQCLYKEASPKAKPNTNLSWRPKLFDYGMDYKLIANARMLHAVSHIFLYVAFGEKNGMDYIKNVAMLQGARTGKKQFLRNMQFPDHEKLYVEKGMFDYPSNKDKGYASYNYLKDTVLLPIDTLLSLIVKNPEPVEGGKVEPIRGIKAIQFRVRAILMSELFQVIGLIGSRPQLPMALDTYSMYTLMTTDFLLVPQLLRHEDGSKYTCTNIPIVLGIIVNLIENNLIEPKLDFEATFDSKKGNVLDAKTKKTLPSMMRTSVQVLFDLNFKTRKENMSLMKLMVYLIYGMNPFVTDRNTEFKVNTDLFDELDDHLEDIVLKDYMKLMFNGTAVVRKGQVFEDVTMNGFLIYDEMRSIHALMNESHGDEEKTLLMKQKLEKFECEHLMRAANLRCHINLLSKKMNAVVEQDDGLGDIGPSTNATGPLSFMSNMRYLESGKNEEKNTFPELLRVLGKTMVPQNIQCVETLKLDDLQTMDEIWASLHMAPFKNNDLTSVAKIEPKVNFMNVSIPRTNMLGEYLGTQPGPMIADPENLTTTQKKEASEASKPTATEEPESKKGVGDDEPESEEGNEKDPTASKKGIPKTDTDPETHHDDQAEEDSDIEPVDNTPKTTRTTSSKKMKDQKAIEKEASKKRTQIQRTIERNSKNQASPTTRKKPRKS